MAPRTGPSAWQTFWAELFIPGERRGITFEVTGLHVSGSDVRVELLHPDGLGGENRWRTVRMDSDGRYDVNGVKWSDFGCSPGPDSTFQRLSPGQAWTTSGLEE